MRAVADLRYIYVSVVDEKVSREEAKAWLYDLYKNQSKHDHIIFCSRVDATISAIEYLKMNNKIV